MAVTFSIVTPSLNQGKFIEQTICSVLSQAGDFFIDYIIMDGGSTDETIPIIQKYEKLLLEKRWPVKCNGITYRWTSEPDRGQSHAINKGFALAQGEILAWINSDDIYQHGALKLVAEVNWKGNDFCYGEGNWISESGEFICKYPTFHPSKYSLYLKCTLCQPTVFFSATAFGSLGELSEKYLLAFDYEYWLRAVLSGQKFVKIPKLLACSRMYSNNKSLSCGRLGEWEGWRLKHSYYQNISLNSIKLKLYRLVIESVTNKNEKLIFRINEGIASK